MNARGRELCRVKNKVKERIDGSVLRWLDHNKRIQNSSIAKRVYDWEWVRS